MPQSTLDHDVAIRLACRKCFNRDYDHIGQLHATEIGWTEVYEVHHGIRRSVHQYWSHIGLCPRCTKLKRKGKLV